MKFPKIAFLFLVSFLAYSCDFLDDQFTKFELDYEFNVVMEDSTGLNEPYEINIPSVISESESEFNLNQTSSDFIEEISLVSLNLEITGPEGRDFTFLESVRAFISAEGLNEIELANQLTILDDVGTSLTLETSDESFLPYLLKEEFSVRMETVFDEIITEDIDIKVSTVFLVDAKIIP